MPSLYNHAKPRAWACSAYRRNEDVEPRTAGVWVVWQCEGPPNRKTETGKHRQRYCKTDSQTANLRLFTTKPRDLRSTQQTLQAAIHGWAPPMALQTKRGAARCFARTQIGDRRIAAGGHPRCCLERLCMRKCNAHRPWRRGGWCLPQPRRRQHGAPGCLQACRVSLRRHPRRSGQPCRPNSPWRQPRGQTPANGRSSAGATPTRAKKRPGVFHHGPRNASRMPG